MQKFEYISLLIVIYLQEAFEDTKGVIRIGKSKKDRQHNGQNKKDKQLSTQHYREDPATKTPLTLGVKSGAQEG